MTIPYLPGWGDSLAQALPQLGQGLAHIINPQMDQQMALKSAMIKDPEILMKFASMERDNPGTLERMGFGKKFGHIVGSINESEDEVLAKKKKKADIAKTEADITESGARTKELGQQGSLAEAQTELAKVHLAELARDNKAKADLFKAIPDLANKDIGKLAADYSIGKVDNPQLLARIQADPNYGPIFEGMSKNIMERAKLALQKRQIDKLDQNEKLVALHFAITNKADSERRLTALQSLQAKYADPKKLEMARLTSASNPQMAQEVAEYDALVKNNFSDIETAKKDVSVAHALVMGAFRQNPEFKNTLDQVEADDKKKQKEQDEINSADRLDPSVFTAREAIRGAGLEAVKKSAIWKSLNPTQQKAAVGLPSDDTSDQDTPSSGYAGPMQEGFRSVGRGIKSGLGGLTPFSGISQPDNQTPDSPAQQQAQPSLTMPPATRESAKGPGVGSTVSGRKLTPYEAMQLQMKDVIAGRPIGDYSDSIDPLYNQNVPLVQNMSTKLHKTGNAFPGNNR